MTKIPEVQYVTLDDQTGQDTFAKLPHAAKDHLRRFGLSRPGFSLALHGTLMVDERPRVPGVDIMHRTDPMHHYQAGTIYTIGKLRLLERSLDRPLQVVDIGSPIEQCIAMAAMDGITLSVVDIRPQYNPAILPYQSITGPATSLPLSDATADVVTSNCVLCHVGDGRYGDALDVDGDVNMLREIKRILKPGTRALVGIGPMACTAQLLFNMHRTYSPEWAHKLFRWAGLTCADFLVYDIVSAEWKTPDLMEPKRAQYYGFCTLERPV